MVVFDFDKTIIEECDSDDWVVQYLGLTHLFNDLSPTMPYNSLMERMMEELHSQGTKIQEIEECLKNIPLSHNTISAIKSAYASGCDLRIVSDANTFFIETILKHHEMLHCFSEINTNPSFVTEDGRLKILPYHDFKSSSHGCNLCPPNLCKGLIIERIQSSSPEKRFIYIGDGKNDFCPSLKLTPRDFVMPRKNFQLWDEICNNPKLIKARVHEWMNGEELETTLKNLINSLILGENHDEFIQVGCKYGTRPVSPARSVQKTVRVPDF